MSVSLAYLELEFGNIFTIDVHGLTKEEARAEIIHVLNSIDVCYNAVLITHGYHLGTVLKNFIRKELTHKSISKKINVDASRTLLLVNNK